MLATGLHTVTARKLVEGSLCPLPSPVFLRPLWHCGLALVQVHQLSPRLLLGPRRWFHALVFTPFSPEFTKFPELLKTRKVTFSHARQSPA